MAKEIDEKEQLELEETTEGEEEKPQVKAEDDGGVTVQLPERKSRKERRAERGKDRFEEVANEARQAREEARRAREEAEEFRRQLYRTQQEVFSRPQQSQTTTDPFKQQLEAIRSEQESIQVAFRSGGITDPGEIDRLKRRFYDLDERREELRYERLKSEMMQQIPRRQEGEDEERILRAEYPEVVNHVQARQFAFGVYNQLVAEGKPATITTAREAMKKAGERYGLIQTTSPPASEAQRAKFGGVPAQAGAKSAATEIRLTKDQQKMALAMYPSLSENEAYAKWGAMHAKAERESQQSD